MKSNEFILEGYQEKLNALIKKFGIDNEDIELAEKIVQIGKDCRPFLNQVWNPMSLLRGIEHEGVFVKKRVRLDARDPLGMQLKTQVMVNNYFEDNFGAPFRNSMLTTGNTGLASGFGDVYIVFPIGKFSYLWSESVEDLNETIWEVQKSIRQRLQSDIQSYDINTMLDQAHYRTNDLDNAIDSGNEIMIRASGYYGIKKDVIDYALPEGVIYPLIKIGMTL